MTSTPDDKDKRIAELEARVLELEELLRQLMQRSSKNSSSPPSRDYKANGKGPYNKGGAKKGHAAHLHQLLSMERVDCREEIGAEKCPRCGAGQLIDKGLASPFQFIELRSGRCLVTHYARKRYRCTCCKSRFSAELPEGVGPSNYGPNLQAAVGMMSGHFHLSKQQVGDFFKHFFGVNMSVGAVCKIEQRLTKALEPAYEEAERKLKAADEVSYVDETSWRCQHQNCYIWLAASKSFSFFRIDQSRSREARDSLLGRDWKGGIVTDRYSAYSNLKAPHQYCLAHIKRNLKAFAEGKGMARTVGEALLKELDQVFHLWHLYQGNSLPWERLKTSCRSHRCNIRDWLTYGSGGEQLKFGRFCARLLEQYDRLWTFLRFPGMEPTNNEAERSLRSLVLWRKKSLGTKSLSGRRYVSVISTVCQTLRKQGRHMLSFISCYMRGLAPALF